MLRFLVCGSRTWTDEDFIYQKIEEWLDSVPLDEDQFTLVHGDAPGADKIAEEAVYQINQTFEYLEHLKIQVDPHPVKKSDWDKHGKAAGPIRNQQMLDSGIDYVLAFFDKPEEESKGTKDMVSRCKKAGVPGKKFFLYERDI